MQYRCSVSSRNCRKCKRIYRFRQNPPSLIRARIASDRSSIPAPSRARPPSNPSQKLAFHAGKPRPFRICGPRAFAYGGVRTCARPPQQRPALKHAPLCRGKGGQSQSASGNAGAARAAPGCSAPRRLLTFVLQRRRPSGRISASASPADDMGDPYVMVVGAQRRPAGATTQPSTFAGLFRASCGPAVDSRTITNSSSRLSSLAALQMRSRRGREVRVARRGAISARTQ